MKIYTATTHFLGQVQDLFAGHDVEVLPKNYKETRPKADLIVFTGGEDIFPEFYGMSAPKDVKFNRARDEWEFDVMRQIVMRRLSTTKVLGICRGHQLLNVSFGGNLYYDIATNLGQSHDWHHRLSWVVNSPLKEIFPDVNSMHHQGIYRVGGDSVRVYAREPVTEVPEVVCWDEKYLGVQFHPELMLQYPNIGKFVEFMENWVKGHTGVYQPVTPTPAKTVSPEKRTTTVKTKMVDYTGGYTTPVSFSWTSENNDE